MNLVDGCNIVVTAIARAEAFRRTLVHVVPSEMQGLQVVLFRRV